MAGSPASIPVRKKEPTGIKALAPSRMTWDKPAIHIKDVHIETHESLNSVLKKHGKQRNM
jgi:hypothetical protein